MKEQAVLILLIMILVVVIGSSCELYNHHSYTKSSAYPRTYLVLNVMFKTSMAAFLCFTTLSILKVAWDITLFLKVVSSFLEDPMHPLSKSIEILEMNLNRLLTSAPVVFRDSVEAIKKVISSKEIRELVSSTNIIEVIKEIKKSIEEGFK